MAAATEENARHEDGAWEADAERWAAGTAVEGPEPVRAGFFCAYSADHDRPCFATSGGTDAERDEAAAYAAEWSRRGQDYIVRHHDGVPSGIVRPSPADGQIIATASGGELRWGPRPRYYCVYQAGKNEACYQAAGGAGADEARATGEAVWRSRAAYGRQYVIREHDGDQVRTVGTALRGQLTPAVGTTVPEMG